MMSSNRPLSIGAWFNHNPEQVIIDGGDGELTRLEVLHQVALIQTKMINNQVQSCALFTADTNLFVATFLACACTEVSLILPANNTEAYIQAIDADCYVGDWPDAWSFDFSQLQAELPKHIGNDLKIDIFTSGSTGEPKRIGRSIQQLLIEVDTLQATFDTEGAQSGSDTIYAATVSHHHIYGLLFKILWPLLTNRILWHKLIAFEESLQALLTQDKSVVLVTSPAFLKRIHGHISHQGQLLQTYSSGGMLTDKQQLLAENKLNTKITQVYGSSETGGVAHRQSKQKWQLFPQVEAQINNDILWVNSPFCYQTDWFCTEDKVQTSSDGFELLGRSDRIVKIEEKRVSLNQVERKLCKHKYIADAAVISLEDGRQFLGAVIVLNKSDQHQLKSLGELKFKQDIKQFLADKLDPVAIPRKMLFTTEPLENSQGKRVAADLARRFETDSKESRSDKLNQP